MRTNKDYKKIKHVSTHEHRNKYSGLEKAFSEVWAKENERSPMLNSGFAILELILRAPNDDDNKMLFNILAEDINQRDATVAATAIQWLGTNCGQGFLHEVNRLGKEYDEDYRKKREELDIKTREERTKELKMKNDSWETEWARNKERREAGWKRQFEEQERASSQERLEFEEKAAIEFKIRQEQALAEQKERQKPFRNLDI